MLKIRQISHHLLRYKLNRPVGGSGVGSVDVLITQVELENGARGLGFSYALASSGVAALAAANSLSDALRDAPFYHPGASWRKLNEMLNRTRRGPNYIALAAIDVALWDAYACARGEPLGIALGGAPRSLPVYGSGGYNAQQTPAEAAEMTRIHVEAGFKAVKPRVGGSRSALQVLQAVRDAVPATVDLMCDANEKCSASQAHRLLSAARECGYLFVEEPLPADDIAGYGSLAHGFPGLVATGEHLQGVSECLPFISNRFCSVIQPDLAMIGGLTPALETARIAQAFGIEVSPHFLPGLFVHLGYACPNLTWLEDFPLLEPMFAGWAAMNEGTMTAGPAPGHGLSLVDDALNQFRLDV
jgi:L-alanine-DL-glutamate epimerase-like enolase superfamily enzyme